MLKALVLVLFICAWAAIAFAIVWALMQLWGFHRRVALAAAVAVAGAFALGAMSPFALPRPASPSGPATVAIAGPAVDTSPHAVRCPAGASIGTGRMNGKLDDVTLAPGALVQLRGWIVGPGGPATSLCIIADGKIVRAAITYGLARPDVAAALSQPADLASGFEASVRLEAGIHALTVGAVEAGGRTVDALNGAPARFQVTH